MAKLSRKKVFFVAAGLFVGLLIAVFFIFSETLATLAVQEGIRFARGQNIRITVGRTSGSPTKVHLQDVLLASTIRTGQFPVPVQFTFDDMDLVPSYSTLALGRKVGATILAKAYQGEIASRFTAADAALDGEITATDLQLALHPQLAGLGLTKGKATLSVPEIAVTGGFLSRLRGEIRLENCEIPKIPTYGFPLKVPPLNDGFLALKADLGPDSFKLEGFRFESSWGTIEGEVQGARPDKVLNQRQEAQGSFSVSLHDHVSQTLGAYLPLISGNKLTPTTKRFTVKVKGVSCRELRPGTLHAKVGVMCFTHSFE